MRNFIYNPINDKEPKGASLCGSEITYKIKVSKFLHVSGVNFVLWKDGNSANFYPMTKSFTDDKYTHYEVKHTFDEVGHYFYHFEIIEGDRRYKLIRSETLDAVEGNADNNYLQLVYSKPSTAEVNKSGGIIYHIFVDRFNKVGDVKCRDGLHLVDWDTPVGYEYDDKGERVNANCYGGNFLGIIDKLNYLKKLNVKTIYLSPVFESHSSHKYDVADYSKVDSMFGTNADFMELIKKAKSKGINIIIDGVFNHTGSDSVYFNKNGRYKTVGAYQSQNSKYYSWYDFSEYPNNYSSWWGIKTLPQTREDSTFFDYISGKNGIVEKYMSMGVSGLRLDVVDELSNNFLHAICERAKSINNKAFIVGEVWEDASTKISYDERKNYFLGGNLDSVTNYPMKNAILDYIKNGNLNHFVSVVNTILDQYPKSVQDNLMNILGTHDTLRVLTYLGADNGFEDRLDNGDYKLSQEEKDRGLALLKLATIMQYTVMGVPTVFYGDECGLEGMRDPYCRRPYPWGDEDLSLIEWYQKLGDLRKNKVLSNGDMKIKYAENGVLIYERSKDDKKIIVIINKGNEPFKFILNKTMFNYFSEDYVSGKITVDKDSAVVLC